MTQDTGYRIQDTGYRIQDKYFLSTDFTSTSEASSGVNKGVMGVIYPPPAIILGVITPLVSWG